jgi:hypothetical protein
MNHRPVQSSAFEPRINPRQAQAQERSFWWQKPLYTLSYNKKKKKETNPTLFQENTKEKSNHTTQKSKTCTPASKKHSPPMARGSFPSNGQLRFEGGVASLSNVRRWARMQAKQKGKRKGETPKFPGNVS